MEVTCSAVAVVLLPQRFTEKIGPHPNVGRDRGCPDGGFSCFVSLPAGLKILLSSSVLKPFTIVVVNIGSVLK
jgi:hypothetical protein